MIVAMKRKCTMSEKWRIWDEEKEYGDLFYKRATGLLEEMESSKAVALKTAEIFEENDRIVDLVNRCKPDVLWVAMTAPRQDIWVYKNRKRLNVRIVVPVGAAFDFFAGTRARAPMWMQKIGLEWLHRTLKEPIRMGLRYLRGFPYFLLILSKEMIGKTRK